MAPFSVADRRPNAAVLGPCHLGDDVIIGFGAVVAGERCEPKRVRGRHILVRHAGGVTIRDGVEIQAQPHVARAVFNEDTTIAEGTTIDALVHIVHNVRIGQGCDVAAMAMIAGSVTVGDCVWIGPHATISSEVKIGDGAFDRNQVARRSRHAAAGIGIWRARSVCGQEWALVDSFRGVQRYETRQS